MSKIIFLDVDGVLNCVGMENRSPGGFVGVGDKQLKYLSKIVKRTNAEIVLVSTWKRTWKDPSDRNTKYLEDRLAEFKLNILDRTYENNPYNRGQGILDYLKDKEIESFVILDDETFDYEEKKLMKNLVQTTFYDEEDGGLNKTHIGKAIKILEGEM